MTVLKWLRECHHQIYRRFRAYLMAFERIISSVSGVFIVHAKKSPVSNELERGSSQLSQKIQLYHIHLCLFAPLDKGYKIMLLLFYVYVCLCRDGRT